jgi:hypothetical protein
MRQHGERIMGTDVSVRVDELPTQNEAVRGGDGRAERREGRVTSHSYVLSEVF